MFSFKTFLTEIYVPTNKRDIKWLSDDNERIHSFHLPSGHKVDVGTVVNSDSKLHTFSFSINDTMSRADIDAPKLPISDHKHIKRGVMKAFNHYIQHKLPVGHTLKVQSLAYDTHEKESKNKLYNTVIDKLLKTAPEHKFEYKKLPISHEYVGDKHLIKKLK